MTGEPDNFARVDADLWRGARPTPQQAQWLVEQGIKSVINLELGQEDKASFGMLLRQLEYRHLPDWEPIATFDPSREDQHIKDFLAAVKELPKPVYVHCRDGQNRTGLAVAAYRLVVKDELLASVLADMENYKGLWGVPDAAYVTSLSERIAEFVA